MTTLIEDKTDFVALAKKYLGKWVAINPDTQDVVAAGDSASEVFGVAIRKGVSEPLIVFVANDYGAYVPCLQRSRAS